MVIFIKKIINSQLSDKNFSEILKGTAVALIARVLAAALALVSSLIVARAYGAESTGNLAIVQTLMMLMSIFAVMGTNVSILKFIPEHMVRFSARSASQVYYKVLKLLICSSAFFGVVFFFISSLSSELCYLTPSYSYFILLTAIFVIFKALMDFNTEAIRGVRSIRCYAFIVLLPHIVMLISLCILFIVFRKVNDPIYAQLAGWIVSAIVGSVIIRGLLKEKIDVNDKVGDLKIAELLETSLPMMITALMNFIVGQVGILILGMYNNSSDVGCYSIAIKLATLTTFILQAVNSMSAPKFSELFHSGQMESLFLLAKKSTKMIFVSNVPILVFLLFFGYSILGFFGQEFKSAYIPLLIVLFGQFVNSLSGSSGTFMNMTGNHRAFRNIMILSAVVNLILCMSLVPRFGMYGSAVSFMVSLCLWNVSSLIFMKIKYGKTTGYYIFF